MNRYQRPSPVDPTALKETTQALRKSNDRLAADLARESVTGLCARLESENRKRERSRTERQKG